MIIIPRLPDYPTNPTTQECTRVKWPQRSRERAGKSEYDINNNMSFHNSASLITYFPQSAGTWVRPGIALYGIYPNPKFKSRVALTPVMQVKARVIHLNYMEKGESVSYGRTYTAKKRIKVATLGIGYADGVHRVLSNKTSFLVKGRRVPQIGTVCMDMTMLDVSNVPGVKVGDTATFFGRDGKAFIPVEEQASLAGTISYELLCAVGQRVPRIYTQ